MNSRSRNLLRHGSNQTTRVQLSLLDRLIDDAPDTLKEAPLSGAEGEDALKRSVRRDLEALLNARRRWRSWPEGFSELGKSLMGYGIVDFASGAFNEPEQRDLLRANVEWAIRTFEPRLTGVRVMLVESADSLDATLHLRIDAMLRTEPAPEPIAFDTLVDSATAEVQVKARSEVPGAEPGDV
jgi:type VI secretion system protein ImpF